MYKSIKNIWPLAFSLFFAMLSAQEFELYTNPAGLRSVNATNGVAVADYDLDGDLDIYFVATDSYKPSDIRTWNRLFSNNGDGTYSDVTSASAISVTDTRMVTENEFGGSKLGASWGDYDNDGYPDLFVTNLNYNQLFHNNGDGTFSDVTQEAGITNKDSVISSSSLWFDYDLDGDLDLYVSNFLHYKDYRNFKTTIGYPNWMFENLGDGTFLDVTDSSGLIDSSRTWLSVAIDVNNDGWLDLYLANDFGVNELFVAQGDKTFLQQAQEYGVNDRYHGMGIAVADLDQNGFFDFYVTNVTEDYFYERNPLFLNTGQNYFINIAGKAGVVLAGWGWGTEFFDMENDGDEDLFVVTGLFDYDNSNRLFKNVSQDSIRFLDESKEKGLDDFEPSRSLVIFDYDNDGDQDILISNIKDYPFLYLNNLPQGNWIDILLEGTKTNRNAFGSVIEIIIKGISHKKYHHGAQYFGQNILPVHFGLGEHGIIDHLKVYWLSGNIDQYDSVRVNQKIKIVEGSLITVMINNETSFASVVSGSLFDNYPNPFNGSTTIGFEMVNAGQIDLNIFNTMGQRVYSVSKTYSSPGYKELKWNPENQGISSLSSGIYLYSIKINNNPAVVGKTIYIK